MLQIIAGGSKYKSTAGYPYPAAPKTHSAKFHFGKAIKNAIRKAVIKNLIPARLQSTKTIRFLETKKMPR